MTSDDKIELAIKGLGALALIALLIGVWVFTSWCEAAAFNRITGKNVSTWDAMFVTLRVQEGVE